MEKTKGKLGGEDSCRIEKEWMGRHKEGHFGGSSSSKMEERMSEVFVGGEGRGGAVMEELAKVCFNFEWFSMRHAKILSRLVDEVEEEKKERKAIEQDLVDLKLLVEQQQQQQKP